MATPTTSGTNSAFDGLEAQLWAAADALRNNMDAAEYKHVVLGLIFLKYISDAFEAKHTELLGLVVEGADPEDQDEYRADNIFWVPPEARWSVLKGNAPQPTIGKLVDDAMTLGKMWKIFHESNQLELRGEFFNLFNHTNYAPPSQTVTSSSFGAISHTLENGRTVQLAAKIHF